MRIFSIILYYFTLIALYSQVFCPAYEKYPALQTDFHPAFRKILRFVKAATSPDIAAIESR